MTWSSSSPAHPQGHAVARSTEDRDEGRNPRDHGVESRDRCRAEQSPDVPCDEFRQALHGGRVHQLVQGPLQRSRLKNGLSAHGLRKAKSRRLAEKGRSAHEIMAVTGHKTLAELQRYTEAAERKKMALRAMADEAVS